MTNAALEIEKKQISKIIRVLRDSLNPSRIYLFGSRVAGTSKKYSDFDIAIEGHMVTFRELRRVKEKLDEVLGVYSCDLIELEKVSTDFKDLIRRQGKIIYERN